MAFLAILLLGLILSNQIQAQGPTATLSGQVRDESGAAIPGAVITVTAAADGAVSRTTAGAEGPLRDSRPRSRPICRRR